MPECACCKITMENKTTNKYYCAAWRAAAARAAAARAAWAVRAARLLAAALAAALALAAAPVEKAAQLWQVVAVLALAALAAALWLLWPAALAAAVLVWAALAPAWVRLERETRLEPPWEEAEALRLAAEWLLLWAAVVVVAAAVLLAEWLFSGSDLCCNCLFFRQKCDIQYHDKKGCQHCKDRWKEAQDSLNDYDLRKRISTSE
jgi:hypothetical protein